jgi:hypothetical protein
MRYSNHGDGEEPNEFFRIGDEGEEDNLAGMLQLDLATTDINLQILHAAIKLLESSWFWGWKSTKTKLEMVRETYKELSMLIDEKNEEDEIDEIDREEK